MSKRAGLAAAIRRHTNYILLDAIRYPVDMARDIVRDLSKEGWDVTISDVRQAFEHQRGVGRPRKPPSEHELQCPHCHKPIIVEMAK